MSFQIRYLPLLMINIIMISFVACSRAMQEDPLIHLVVEDSLYIDDGGTFKQKSSTNVLSLNKLAATTSTASPKRFSVDDYGAKGDAKTNDSQAFKMTWQVACSYSGGALVVVPKKNYLLKPIRFTGPCKSSIEVQITGTLIASDNRTDYNKDPRHWIIFESVSKLTVDGGGAINGNGNRWWQNSCKTNKKLPCMDAPTAVTFYKCDNSVFEDLTVKNGQQIQVSFQNSKDVRAIGLTVTAPGDSPNTDGIHITNTQNIQISNSVIGTGDDCISIESGSKNVQATDITCGPGHGISIGSLGDGKSEAAVSEITVNRAKLSGTTNGVRIKTWQGGSGSANNIKFQNIHMDNVTNPIIIDQNYCDQKEPCNKQKSAVQILNVLYQNINGTSASDEAVQFDCSENFPCKGIVLENIEMKLESGGKAKASCNHVKYSYIGDVSPRCT